MVDRTEEPIRYLDKKVGWVLYPILGLSFIFFANENDFQTLVHLPSFKWDVLFALMAVATSGLYLAWLVRFLDRKNSFSWDEQLKRRLFAQLLLGVILPWAFTVVLELIYLKISGFAIPESSIFILEMPLAFLYLFLINLLYYLNYTALSRAEPKDQDISESKILVSVGSKENLLPIKKIAFLRSADKTLWLQTFQDEQIYLTGSLNEWEEKLPGELFYRINRQLIANRASIEGVEPTETRRLRVLIKNCDGEFFIPKVRATAFRAWWSG